MHDTQRLPKIQTSSLSENFAWNVAKMTSPTSLCTDTETQGTSEGDKRNMYTQQLSEVWDWFKIHENRDIFIMGNLISPIRNPL